MLLIVIILSLFTFVNSEKMLISYRTKIPNLVPIVKYKGKYISLINSDEYKITDEYIITENNTNITIQDSYNNHNLQWNLDILDNTIDNKYTYNYSGLGSIVYVIDSGLTISSEFDNRIKTGISFDRDNYTKDCLGHGTHVASIIGSKTYGVAKNSTIIPVKVFGCSRTTYTSTIIKAIYWVIVQQKGIVNLSLGGNFNSILNDAIKDLIDAGFIVVSAAGNNGLNACNFSPSSEPNSIVVGCTGSNKMVCNSSNEGKCVTLFAPGQNILGLSNFPNKTTYMSGTSMSAPHVSGIAATLYSVFPGITQRDIKQLIIKISANGTLSGFKINNSPNLEVREFIGLSCIKALDVFNCKNTPMCIFIKDYGCKSFNFCGFKTMQECLIRKRCEYSLGKCKLKVPKN
jgi:subtilisin family serine protease